MSDHDISRIGVAGAGTMGAGIAQLAALSGFDTMLWDPDADALSRAEDHIGTMLDRGVEQGRWEEAEASEAKDRLTTVDDLEDLAANDLVIEAAPEELGLKRDLFDTLCDTGDDTLVLATNTSSLSVGAIARGCSRPER
ncbi:MAG: 3-hydroxyacyl-CoA dehydrogenase family protein, partial [Solirubrobacterales bacterium]